MVTEPSTTYVALLRGVNVGGVKVLMAPLRELAIGLGFQDVKTHIASGNLIFQTAQPADGLENALRVAIANQLGVDTPIRVFNAVELREILCAHPWSPDKGNQSHVYFCWEAPTLDQSLYEHLKSPSEELRIIGGHVHFHAPEGLGRSKLAEKLPKIVQGTPLTGRNLNTVRKLVDIASEA